MSQPRYLHELADERAGQGGAADPGSQEAERPSVVARPPEVNVFDVYAPVGPPAPAQAAPPPGARVVEGFHEALDSIVIPAVSGVADRLRRRQDRLPRRFERSNSGWRRRLAVVAVGGAILAVAATAVSSVMGGDERDAPTAAAGPSKQHPDRAQLEGAAEAATPRSVDHELTSLRARGYAATARARALSRRERPTKPRLRHRPRRARPRVVRDGPNPPPSTPATPPPSPAPPPPSTPVVVSTPAPPAPVPASPPPQPAAGGAADEFGFER
jgi:hypothetical protein